MTTPNPRLDDLLGTVAFPETPEERDAACTAIYALVADAKAGALEEAAARFKERSDTLHNTMLEMTASKEYGLEDIVRYGAYSAEANTTATWLRTKAAVIRNQS